MSVPGGGPEPLSGVFVTQQALWEGHVPARWTPQADIVFVQHARAIIVIRLFVCFVQSLYASAPHMIRLLSSLLFILFFSCILNLLFLVLSISLFSVSLFLRCFSLLFFLHLFIPMPIVQWLICEQLTKFDILLSKFFHNCFFISVD
jgi:hypothetical protein